MKTRKLFCAVLIAAIFLSMPCGVRAETIPVGSTQSVQLNGSVRLPEINVTVPETGKILINPYNMVVEMGEGSYSGQIISEPAFIENYSDVNIQVDVAITAEIYEGSSMTLSTSSTASSTSTSKRAFIYFEMHPADNDNWSSVEWDDTYDKTKHVVVSATAEKTKTNIAVLSAKTLDGDIAPGGYGAFRLTGDAIKSPKNEWTEDDGLNVNIVFTFVPLRFE